MSQKHRDSDCCWNIKLQTFKITKIFSNAFKLYSNSLNSYSIDQLIKKRILHIFTEEIAATIIEKTKIKRLRNFQSNLIA